MKRKILLFTLAVFTSGCLFSQNSKYVNLFIGTAGDNGQVAPAACVPYGMVSVCPDNSPRSHSGYDYDITLTDGISVNRLSGTGCGGNGGNLRLKPSLKDAEVHIDKSSEIALPGYYAATLGDVKCEMTATHNIAVERYYYPTGADACMTLDIASSFTSKREVKYTIISPNRISGFISMGTTCDRGTYSFWFDMYTDQAFEVLSEEKDKIELSFGKSNGKPIEVRIALSPIDEQTARKENELASKKQFNRIVKDAAAQWNRILNRIDIKGGTEEDRTIFYTSVYRTFLSPGNITSYDSQFRATDGTLQQAEGFTYYGAWSMWDSYRTKFPLIALLDPAAMRDFSISLSRLYRHGIKDWATPHESMPTVRTEHSSVVMLDAYEKGITDIQLAEAYPSIVKELQALPLDRPDLRIETAIDYWAAARIAQILKHDEDADSFARHAEELFTTTWEKEFMTPDSTYTRMRNSGLYQGNRWQYRWAAPQYLDQMAEMSGGKQILVDQLNYFFKNNLNNQGNEPGIHAPFVFNRLGQPKMAQQVVTRMLTEETTHLYGGNAEYPTPIVSRIFKAEPKGFLPEMDEDDGTMCAWYTFSAMGIFPLVVGDPSYEITSPLFDEVTLKLQNGKKFKIVTKQRNTSDQTIKSCLLNGKPVPTMSLLHSDITAGGTLELIY